MKTGSSTTVTSRDRCCNLPTRCYNSGSTYTVGMGGTRALDPLRTQKVAVWAARPVGVGGQLWGHLLGYRMGGLADTSTSPTLCPVGMETISHGVCVCVGGHVACSQQCQVHREEQQPRPLLPGQAGSGSARGAIHSRHLSSGLQTKSGVLLSTHFTNGNTFS